MLKLNNVLDQAQTIAVGGHVHPDGDCVGSCMAMYQYITNDYPDKEVDVYLEDIPVSFHRIKGTDAIRHEIPEGKVYDLFICLDCGDIERLGFSQALFSQAKHTVCIDHHMSNLNFADENYIFPDASSTSELVYDLIDKEKITLKIAEALYLGIVHDTGVFQYSCTAPSTMRAAAALLETGIDASDLIMKTYYEKTYAQQQILGRSLAESRLVYDGEIIVCSISHEVMSFYGVVPKDLNGIVSQLRNTEGVHAAIMMYEMNEGEYKISLRSDEAVDVNRVAGYFGGGGHVRASGLKMCGTPDQIADAIIAKIVEQLEA